MSKSRKNKMRLLSFYGVVLVALAGMSASCSSMRPIAPSGQKDSLVIHVVDSVVYRDSVIFVELPKEEGTSTVPADDTSYLETSVAESVAWLESGKLFHSLRNKEAALPVPVVVKNYLRTEQRDHLKIQWREVEVEKKLTGWQSAMIYLGKVALGAIGLLVLLLCIRIVLHRRM